RLMGLYGFIFSHPLFFLAIGLVFFHSFNVGSDTRTYPMTLVYPITGILVFISIIYRLVPGRVYRWLRRPVSKPSTAESR
ncbi:MAG: hypothetical protein HY377_00690, partial [Candidatus Blackburnbacteria bacterium]|nr:hypothetical protein [Candidatus Blackburnbacteria bacterium]